MSKDMVPFEGESAQNRHTAKGLQVPRSIHQVDPWDVRLDDQPTGRDVKVQLERLLAEGQIEPIEVVLFASTSPRGKYTLDPGGWVYAGAQIAAARELKWPTVLVTY
jgi:hypothetical protein